MTTILIFTFLGASIAGCWTLMQKARRRRETDKATSLDLLRQARDRYCWAENDVIKLDSLYEITYRKSLIALKDDNVLEYDRLRHEAELLLRLKNKVIEESVKFDDRCLALAGMKGEMHHA